MLADIEAGKVGTVIVKDMSRIGRDYLQVGFYTEVMFREKGVHFIAISNGVDSERRESAEFAPFLNIMNEWYVRDTSRKITTVLKARGMSGKAHTTNRCCYGYKKSAENPDKWVIDEEAAEVVRRIFNMCLNGKGPYQIARELAEDKVERPEYYLGIRGRGVNIKSFDMEHPYMWRGGTVKTILTRMEYTGCTVNFRTKKESYKDKRPTKVDSSEWIIFEDNAELEGMSAKKTDVDVFMELVKKHTTFEELTPAILNEFVDKIMVYKAVGSGANRTQDVDIYLNYIGRFVVPEVVVELTEEEKLAEAKRQEKLEKKRASNRKYMARKREEARKAWAEIEAEKAKAVGQ